VSGQGFTGKELILLGGGLFLIFKAVKEIHHKLEAADDDGSSPTARTAASFAGVIAQIMLLDMVFSIDSVITAVGMTDFIAVMIAANVVALIVMLVLGKHISEFVEKHPSIKVLALSFLLMIGLVLVCEGFGYHIPKATVYGAMAFGVFVELINIRTTRKKKIVALNQVPHTSDIPRDSGSAA
jgi:predicted tellurium resistance membrane protein TerC